MEHLLKHSGRRLRQRQNYLAHNLYLLIIVFVLLITFGVSLVQVSGQSMQPSLQDGSYLLLDKLSVWRIHLGIGALKHGDIIVFRPPRGVPRAKRPGLRTFTSPPQFIKRLIAVEGDSISVNAGTVVLNGQALEEPYIQANKSAYLDNFPEVLLDKGDVVALEGFALAELPEYLQATLEIIEPPNPSQLKASYVSPVSYVGSLTLKPNYYFVLGDNRGFKQSEDSRLFGVIHKRRVVSVLFGGFKYRLL